MSQHEVEVKPYGQKNEVETRIYTSANRSADTDSIKPPYGQKNETSTSYSNVGSRTDVEVKPFGTQDLPRESVLKPQRVATTTVRPMNLEQWRNPLLATLLGITLALTLLSLSYLPRAISNVWHWGTNWGSHQQSKSFDAYESATKNFPHAAERETMYQQGKDMVQNAKETGDSIYNRAKQSGEDLINTAKDTIYHTQTGSVTQEAKRMACQTAMKAEEMACEGVDMSSWSKSSMMPDKSTINRAHDAARDAQERASGIYEQAKQKASDVLQAAKETVTYPLHAAQDKASDVLQAAKDTVTYPIHAAQDTVAATGERLQAAKDTVMNTGSNIEDSTYNTLNAAKDRVEGSAAQTIQAAKDTVLGAGQAAKDTVMGAGQAAKNLAENAVQGVKDTIHGVKDTVSNAASSSETTTVKGQARGPTKVKVEVTEL